VIQGNLDTSTKPLQKVYLLILYKQISNKFLNMDIVTVFIYNIQN